VGVGIFPVMIFVPHEQAILFCSVPEVLSAFVTVWMLELKIHFSAFVQMHANFDAADGASDYSFSFVSPQPLD